MSARRLALTALLVGAAALAVAFVARTVLARPLGEMLFARAAAANIGYDALAERGDGLHVFLCGTGSPFPDPTRAGPCVGVVAGARVFVFDTGVGGMRTLGRMGFPTERLERVFLTHLHSDHIDGMGEVLLQAWITGTRTDPLPVSGPRGVDAVIAGFNAAYAVDAGYRTGHHGPGVADPAGFGGRGEPITPTPTAGAETRVYDAHGVVVTAFLVNHSPVEPALGYRIDYGGRSLVISGDTLADDELTRMASGADLLLHDALNARMVDELATALSAAERPQLAKVMVDIQDYHAAPEDAARTAQAAGVGQLVLTHLVPPLPSRMLYPAFLGDAPELFDGPLQVGEDGVLYSLPSNSDRVNRARVIR